MAGSWLCLDSDRGIFVINILKRIIDRLIYNDKYEQIGRNMSDSNIGGRRKKNIKNHLFIIHRIINAVIEGDSEAIDIPRDNLHSRYDIWSTPDVLL